MFVKENPDRKKKKMSEIKTQENLAWNKDNGELGYVDGYILYIYIYIYIHIVIKLLLNKF